MTSSSRRRIAALSAWLRRTRPVRVLTWACCEHCEHPYTAGDAQHTERCATCYPDSAS